MIKKKIQVFLDDLCFALNREPGTLKLSDAQVDIPEWDSVGHLAIISTVDSELDVPVDNEEMRNFSSIGELVEKLRSRGALEE